MKRTAYLIAVMLFGVLQGHAISNNTVQIVYNGTSATITIADNIKNYVTVNSGTSSHVSITQSSSFAGVNKTTDNEDGEIYYALSGSSNNGEFYLEGSYKCEIDLNGVTLTNPAGPALNIQNGKRIAISAKKGSTNTLTDGSNQDYNGCIHVKGHLKLKGKGELNVAGKSKHAIYSKEYLEIKNLTLNITAAQKDGIHCKEYFLLESGTVSINGVGDDGIQCELAGTTSTGITTNHEDEDTGSVYQEDGTLTISNYGGKAINADGSITYDGGKQYFDTTDTTADIPSLKLMPTNQLTEYYDLAGRRIEGIKSNGITIVRSNGKTFKVVSQ